MDKTWKTVEVIRIQAEQVASTADPKYWKDLRRRQLAATKEKTDGQSNNGDSVQGD